MDVLAQLGIDLTKWTEQLSRVGWPVVVKTVVEILIILYAAIWLWGRIRGTQAARLVKGVMVLVLIAIASWMLGFTIITSILQQSLPVLILALVIIFQPELRRGLRYLGKTQTFRMDLSLADAQKERAWHVIEQVIAAVRELSRRKTGALIVIEPPQGETDYLSPGVPVNADVSSNLLLSIFFPNSPLHDGAAVIRQDKIVAAGVILPMTDNPKLSYRYGTRHRAAIGLSELHDGLCIVVSEETGSISGASRGMLVRYNNADELADPLAYLYLQAVESKAPSPIQSFLALFGRRPARDTTSGADKQAPSPVRSGADLPQAEDSGEEKVSAKKAAESADPLPGRGMRQEIAGHAGDAIEPEPEQPVH
jgi:diadenylate cyclase